MAWYRLEVSEGKALEFKHRPSMRKVKAELGITNRRVKLSSHSANVETYRLEGTSFTFSIIECY